MIRSIAIARTTSTENDVPSIIFVRRENCVEMAPTVIYWMLRLARLRSTGVRRTSQTGTTVGVLMDTQVFTVTRSSGRVTGTPVGPGVCARSGGPPTSASVWTAPNAGPV